MKKTITSGPVLFLSDLNQQHSSLQCNGKENQKILMALHFLNPLYTNESFLLVRYK